MRSNSILSSSLIFRTSSFSGSLVVFISGVRQNYKKRLEDESIVPRRKFREEFVPVGFRSN